MSDTEAISIGNSLRKRRTELGIGFEEIETRTRIRRTYLEALEAERFEAFPGEVYLKGYLKGYAECLGLDPQPLLQALQELKPPVAPPLPVDRAPQPQDVGSPAGAVKRLRAVVLAVVLVVAFFGWRFGQRPPATEAEVAAPAATIEAAAGPASVVAEGTNPAGASDRSTAESAPLPASPSAESEGGTTVEGTNAAAAPTAPDKPEASPATATATAEVPVSPPAGNQAGVLRLHASGPGQLELTIDGRPAQRYTLQANTILSWKVSHLARIYLENPGNARLWLGGRELDLGGRNQIVLQPDEEPNR